jgi:hypothetical protein
MTNYAEISWQFQVKAGPDAPISEVPVCGDKIVLSDLPEGMTNLELALQAAGPLGRQFIEAYLHANGAEAGNGSCGLAKYRVRVTIEDV